METATCQASKKIPGKVRGSCQHVKSVLVVNRNWTTKNNPRGPIGPRNTPVSQTTGQQTRIRQNSSEQEEEKPSKTPPMFQTRHQLSPERAHGPRDCRGYRCHSVVSTNSFAQADITVCAMSVFWCPSCPRVECKVQTVNSKWTWNISTN